MTRSLNDRSARQSRWRSRHSRRATLLSGFVADRAALGGDLVCRSRRRSALLVGALLFSCGVAHGATNSTSTTTSPTANLSIELDLATTGRGSRSKSVSPGTYEIQVRNLVPKYLGFYSIRVQKLQLQPPPLDIQSKIGKVVDRCDQPTIDALNNLADAADEAVAGKALKVLQAKPPDGASCPAQLLALRDFEQRMTESIAVVTLAENEAVAVTVSRGSGNELAIWDVTYSTSAGPAWISGYGFTFIPNRDDTYFSRPTADGKSFTISKNERRDSIDFVPSIIYTYAYAPMGRHWSAGPTAGLGFDLSSGSPTVFLGASLVCNLNLQIVGGVVMNRQQRLLGQYNVGDSIGSNLTNDQLTSKTYRPNAFFGITLNLASNPFKAAPAGSGTVASVSSAVSVGSLTLSPNKVLGGGASIGTATLTGPAPTGGAVVTLVSDSKSVVVPGTVLIAAGSTLNVFNVTSLSVAADTTATISGSYNGTQKGMLVVFAPLIPASITLKPTSVAVGEVSTGTVALTGPAPSGGAVVSLSSSDVTVATVPASATIPEGKTSADFPITAHGLPKTGSVTITASLGGASQSATLAVAK
jgi:hypothetical protein